jgi:hypothetical protein
MLLEIWIPFGICILGQVGDFFGLVATTLTAWVPDHFVLVFGNFTMEITPGSDARMF